MSSLDTTTSNEILFRINGDQDRRGPATGSVLVEENLELRLPVRPRSVLPSRVAIVGNYSPRQCGIATFTTDLCDAVSAEFGATELLALPVNDTDEGYLYPERVRFELSEGNLSSYRQAADFLNFSKIDLVCLQHEFGIFGGAAGSHVLELLRALRDLDQPRRRRAIEQVRHAAQARSFDRSKATFG